MYLPFKRKAHIPEPISLRMKVTFSQHQTTITLTPWHKWLKAQIEELDFLIHNPGYNIYYILL